MRPNTREVRRAGSWLSASAGWWGGWGGGGGGRQRWVGRSAWQLVADGAHAAVVPYTAPPSGVETRRWSRTSERFIITAATYQIAINARTMVTNRCVAHHQR